MDDEDLINLQRLLGRGPQESFLPPLTPFHMLLADALSNYGPAAGTTHQPTSSDWAGALDAYGRLDDPDQSDQQSTVGRSLSGFPSGQNVPSEQGDAGTENTSHQQITSASQPTSATNGIIQIADNDRKRECRDICSDLALPTKDHGVSFGRCYDTCMGNADWPEWRKYFPNNRSPLPQVSPAPPAQPSQSQSPPWWLPLLPLLIRVAPAAVAAA
jgi:hypothetical protein